MAEFHFHFPIQVRFADLDPLWHVNNARYLTYLEQARSEYLKHLGLWDGKDFFKIGVIVGDIHIRYLAPVLLGQSIQVETRISKIGNKSFTFEYQIVDDATGKRCATAESIMVTFDYHKNTSIPVPAAWRETIGRYEGQDFSKPA